MIPLVLQKKKVGFEEVYASYWAVEDTHLVLFALAKSTSVVSGPGAGSSPKPFFFILFFFLFLCIQTTDPIKAKCFFCVFFPPISVIAGTIGKTKAALADYY